MHIIHSCSSTRASTANVSASSDLPLRPLHNLSQGIIQDLRSGSESNDALLRLHDIVDNPAVRWEHPQQPELSSLQFSEALTESDLGRWAQDVEGIPRRAHCDNNTLPDIPASLIRPVAIEAEPLTGSALGTWAQDCDDFTLMEVSDPGSSGGESAIRDTESIGQTEPLTENALGTWAQDVAGIPRTVVHR